MSLLVLDNVKKHFAAQEVLSGATFRIDPGEKIIERSRPVVFEKAFPQKRFCAP